MKKYIISIVVLLVLGVAYFYTNSWIASIAVVVVIAVYLIWTVLLESGLRNNDAQKQLNQSFKKKHSNATKTIQPCDKLSKQGCGKIFTCLSKIQTHFIIFAAC